LLRNCVYSLLRGWSLKLKLLSWIFRLITLREKSRTSD